MEHQTQAESSTAPLEIPAAGSPEYKHYKLTGELPQKSTQADSSRQTSDGTEESSTSGTEAESSTASQKSTQERISRNPKTDRRFRELTDENKTLKQRLADIESRVSEVKTQNRSESSTEHRETQPTELKEPVEPKEEDFKGPNAFTEFQAAMRKYAREVAKWESRQAVLADRQQRALEEGRKKLDAELAEGAKRYGEEKISEVLQPVAKEILTDKEIGNEVKRIIAKSPVLVDLLYVFASDSAQFKAWQKLARTDPDKAIREAVILEQLVAEELSRKKSNGKATQAEQQEAEEVESEEDVESDEELGEADELEGEEDEEESEEVERDSKTGRFKKAPARKITQAKGPTREVKGTNTAPADEAQAALERGDFASYRRIKNAQDLKARGQKA